MPDHPPARAVDGLSAVSGEYSHILSKLAYAHGGPLASGEIKRVPADFKVFEELDFVPGNEGDGEHDWLFLRKTRLNTEQLAKALARHAGVAYRDVSWSGMKDFQAVTEQWFSVWRPGRTDIDWSSLAIDGVTLLGHCQHPRKLRRGSHKHNRFELRIHDFNPDVTRLDERLQQINELGVPNYYTAQRFGHNAANLLRAEALFTRGGGGKRKQDRHLRGLLLSAARAFLFNVQLDDRVRQHNWSSLHVGEPVNLQSTASVFNALNPPEHRARLNALDIHPTCALYGRVSPRDVEPYADLYQHEAALTGEYPILVEGLTNAGLSYARRATRIKVDDLDWNYSDGTLELEFRLARGQYATAVLRELVAEQRQAG